MHLLWPGLPSVDTGPEDRAAKHRIANESSLFSLSKQPIFQIVHTSLDLGRPFFTEHLRTTSSKYSTTALQHLFKTQNFK
ncbi:hypothetical protein EYC84_007786 [Monilinia fructicola]|uniref:Uncharacterized protein n=1 Tax=Monilinia fructicola TaxID=38448 RepID=A0A5M9JHM1_MONFR|nr:hypothetical protein EYC84_007786 [Monilinia fructicola]